MSGPEYRQMEEVERERFFRCLSILQKAQMARRDGYFTQEDLEDMQREFGLSTHRNPTPTLETF